MYSNARLISVRNMKFVFFAITLFVVCNAEVNPCVKNLLSEMSLKHKIGQMTQLNIDDILHWGTLDINLERLETIVGEWSPGSFLNSPFSAGQRSGRYAWTAEEWRGFINTVQEVYMNTTGSSKVKMVFGIDSVHGAVYVQDATIFPQQINAGASFNPDLAELMGLITAKDTRLAGMHWAFAPILGIATQPLWPRVFETFGEDPLLSSVLGAANILGLQGHDPSFITHETGRVAACMKHFVGYPNPRSGHDRSPEWIPDRLLYQYYVPPFYAAVQAGVTTAMESYNELNNVPVVSSSQYLKRLLRDTLNFTGMMVTDWAEIENMIDWHKLAPTREDAVRIAMQRTSIDMSMVPWFDSKFAHTLYNLVNSGVIPESRVDESVERILQLKYSLGLLAEQPPQPTPPPPPAPTTQPGDPQDRQHALDLVRESVILLRNEGDILPLDAGSMSRLVVTGPCVDSLTFMTGGWSLHWQGAFNDDEFSSGATILDAINAHVQKTNANMTVEHLPGCGMEDEVCPQWDIDAVVAAAQGADAVVVCVGEKNYAEKPGNIDDLVMTSGPRQLVSTLAALDTPVVMVLVEGRPRVLAGCDEGVDAALLAFLPGPEGGTGIAEVLFGEVNPSGRMPLSYPSATGNFPIQYWHGPSEDEAKFQWEFGHGLSFTSFEYSELELSTQAIRPGDNLEVQLTVTNTGDRKGKTTVLLFVTDDHRITTPEVKLLKGFHKTKELMPQETHQVTFTLSCDDLAFVDVDMKWVVEPGNFTLTVGAGEESTRTATFSLLPPEEADPQQQHDTIPWGMWGQAAGFQLPLAVDLSTLPSSSPLNSTDTTSGRTWSPMTITKADSQVEVVMFIAGTACGVGIASVAFVLYTIARRRVRTSAQSTYLEMESFTVEDNASTVIAPAPRVDSI